MTLRETIEIIPSLGRLMEQTETMSAPGRRALYASEWQTDVQALERELDANAQLLRLYAEAPDSIRTIQHALMELKEIRGSVARLKEGEVLDDIELFELKNAAIVSEKLRKALHEADVDCVEIPDLERVVNLLDPQNTRVPHFYIYDIYSEDLANVRRKIKAIDAKGGGEDNDEYRQLLMYQACELEDKVRTDLSAKLRNDERDIAAAMSAAARLDLIQARAGLAHKEGFCRPKLSDDRKSEYEGLFNPVVRKVLQERGKSFQAVDITLVAGPTVITGANMAGKSVLLKSIALAQALAQYGFNVPAAKSTVAPVDEILLCIGDEQSELTGLSSFASEMLRIDSILQRLRQGNKALVLIDEPARTTNPTEGKAIVDALLRILSGFDSAALVATHYSGLTTPCRRLRVKGFIEDRCRGGFRVGDIKSYIDYSLVEEQEDMVPHEAVRIARLLGVDATLLDNAEELMTTSSTLT